MVYKWDLEFATLTGSCEISFHTAYYCSSSLIKQSAALSCPESYRGRKICLPPNRQDHLFLLPSPAGLLRQHVQRHGHSYAPRPRPPPGGVADGQGPAPSRPLSARPLLPTASWRPERARAPPRPARRRERALCGRCRHVVVVVRRRRRRRRSTPTRRSSGPGAAPRRPWLGALWGGGGGRAVAGLTMSCRPVRSPPPPPLPSPPGGEEELEEGPAGLGRGAAAVTLPRRRQPAGGCGRRAWPSRGVFRAAVAAARGRRGEWRLVARLGPDPRRQGGGFPGPGRPDRTWRDGPLGLGCEALPPRVRIHACGPREVSVPRPPGPGAWAPTAARSRGSPRGERRGPGTCGKGRRSGRRTVRRGILPRRSCSGGKDGSAAEKLRGRPVRQPRRRGRWDLGGGRRAAGRAVRGAARAPSSSGCWCSERWGPSRSVPSPGACGPHLGASPVSREFGIEVEVAVPERDLDP